MIGNASFVHKSHALHRAMFEMDIHCKLPWREIKQNGFRDNALCACASQQRFLSLGSRQTKALYILGQKAVYSCGEHTLLQTRHLRMYTLSNKNPSVWNFLSPEPEVTCGIVSIIIPVVLLSPYLRIRGVSLSSIHYNQSHRVYINWRQQYICLIWN